MFSLKNNQKSDKRGDRFDLHFSNFHATQVPKGWDKLGVSIVSTESGKINWESSKAPVLRGCCRWGDTLSESICIDDDPASACHLFKFVVSTGWSSLSSRSGVVLGEGTVNLGDYTTSLKTCCVDVSLVLEKCSYKTILQMKIECTISPNKDTTCIEEMESSSLSSSEEASFGRHSFSLNRNLSTPSPTNSNSYSYSNSSPSFHNQHLYQNSIHFMEEQEEEGTHQLFHNKELEEQLKYLKESNSNLSMQLYKTQQSNIDLLSVLQEMEQTIENQRIAAIGDHHRDNELMQSLKNKVDDLEIDCTDLTDENLQLVFKLKQMEKELELQQEDFMIKHLFYQQLSTKHTTDQQSHQTAAVDIDDGCRCESSVDEGLEMAKATYFINQRGQHQTILNKLAHLTNLVVTKDDDDANATAETIILDDNILQSIDHQLGNLHQMLESRVQREVYLEGERVKAKSEEEEEEEEIKVLRNEKTELETMLNIVGDEKHQLEVKLSKLEASVELECNQSELEANLCEVEDENLRLSERICGLEAQLRYLTNEKEASRSELHHSESRCSELEQHVIELEGEVKEREKKVYEMQMQVLEAMEECGFLRVMHQKMQATAETVMEECRSLEESNLELRSHKMELHERCNLLEAELRESRSSFGNLLEEIQVLREKLVSLSEETNHKERALNAELDSLIHETTTISTNSLILLLQGFDIPSLRKEEVKLKVDESEARLRDELAVSKQNEEVLISDKVKLLGLVEDLKSKESRTKARMRSLEMKLKDCELKRKELVEDVTTLKVKLSRSKVVERKLEEATFEKQRVEASLEMIKGDYERVKKEKGLIVERMSRLEREVLKLEVCRNSKEILEDRVLRLEGDLTAKEALYSEEAELKNELARVRRANKQLQRRLLALQEEEENQMKKNSSASSYCSSSYSCIVEEDDNSWVGDRDGNNTPKREVADDNGLLKKKIQLLEDQLKSEGDMEKELMELRENYFNMSLKYALVEAEREHLVMKLRSK